MRKEKLNQKNKGITLIALIITIIVMLILVGVTITVAIDGGLFSKAKEAGTKYEQAAQQDAIMGLQYEYEIAKATEEFTGNYDLYLDAYILETEYGIKIGDKVDYDETKGGTVTVSTANMEWRVLGVNDLGQIELISTIPTTETVELTGMEGYVNAKTLINQACSAYGEGDRVASVRSLTAEDINKLGDYNPETDYDGYGEKYTYQYDETDETIKSIETSLYEEYKNDMANNNWIDTGYTELYTPDGVINEINIGPYHLETTEYSYDIIKQLSNFKTEDGKLWSSIITKDSNDDLASQWLDTNMEYATEEWYGLSVCGIFDEELGFYVLVDFDNSTDYGNSASVRPVVTLESDVEFTIPDANGVYGIQ